MAKTEREENIEKLCREVETSIGKDIRTPRDFIMLRESLYARTHILLSVSTLMRVWGYMAGGTPRDNTLSELARFVGYSSFAEFCNANDPSGSGFVGKRHFRVSETLRRGDILTLTWQPGRRCVARYMGDCQFVVLESENTRLLSGNTFRCSLVIEGEPLYLDDLHRDASPPMAYVCGKISGIRFQIN